jgi:hypothetical protein
MTPEELVAQRLPYVMKTRDSYREFWKNNVVDDEFMEQVNGFKNSPITRRLSGILSEEVRVEDYEQYLESKYIQSRDQ